MHVVKLSHITQTVKNAVPQMWYQKLGTVIMTMMMEQCQHILKKYLASKSISYDDETRVLKVQNQCKNVYLFKISFLHIFIFVIGNM